MTYRKGDILLVPLPFTDLSARKKRPVLVISNDDFNSNERDIVVAAISSNLAERRHSVFLKDKDLVSGRLPYPSQIKCDKVYTIDKAIVIRKFASAKKEKMLQVYETVCRLLK